MNLHYQPDEQAKPMIPVKTIEIPQEILDSARLTTDEIKTELAFALYAQGRLSIGKARETFVGWAWLTIPYRLAVCGRNDDQGRLPGP